MLILQLGAAMVLLVLLWCTNHPILSSSFSSSGSSFCSLFLYFTPSLPLFSCFLSRWWWIEQQRYIFFSLLSFPVLSSTLHSFLLLSTPLLFSPLHLILLLLLCSLMFTVAEQSLLSAGMWPKCWHECFHCSQHFTCVACVCSLRTEV